MARSPRPAAVRECLPSGRGPHSLVSRGLIPYRSQSRAADPPSRHSRSRKPVALLNMGGVCTDRKEHPDATDVARSEEHTSELQSLMRISYAAFCLKKKTHTESTKTHI